MIFNANWMDCDSEKSSQSFKSWSKSCFCRSIKDYKQGLNSRPLKCKKNWTVKPPHDPEKTDRLRSELGVSFAIAGLLLNRGVDTFERARAFFRPSLDMLHDPFLMRDMDKAVERIERAIAHGEKILVYGDYDVDGTTAVAVVYGFFSAFCPGLSFYVPDRYREGYGISRQGIDYAAANGFSLVIALDCGIRDVEKIDYAASKNIDFIIGDHHLPGDRLPNAVAVLDPKRADCAYPYRELSGCGIGFKVVQAFVQKNGMDPQLSHRFLDLVAVSIASDIVPITGENRVLAHFGLKKLNSSPNCGLQALIDLSPHGSGTLSVSDVVFRIGPRINAAGRIDHAKNAVKLLISKSLQEAKSYSATMDEQNSERKVLDQKITEEALEMIDRDENLRQRKSTVLFKADWHKGVIGIVASRLMEKYYRPTVILTKTDGHLAGSARSVAGFDLYEALSACDGLLHQYGGHKYAAGLTMAEENVRAFREKFESVVAQSIAPEMLRPEIPIETAVRLREIDAKFYRILKQFEPFGPQNEAPIFLTEGVEGAGRIVGTNHLKMTVRESGSPAFECIGFGLGEHIAHVNSGKKFDICYTIEENEWRGKKTLQLNIKGIRH